MKALLIDPEKQTITPIDFGGKLHDMYAVMGCQMVEAPVEFKNGDTLWCDEEGKLKEDDEIIGGFTYTKDWHDIITGKCLVTGTTADGETTDCKSTPEYVMKAWRGFTWVSKQQCINYINKYFR